MSRYKGPAPPTPKRPKRDSSALSLVATFDELVREGKVLSDPSAEEEFLRFVLECKDWRRRWSQSEAEVCRLQAEMSVLLKDASLKDLKFRQARSLIEDERKRRLSAENERDALRSHLGVLKNFLLESKVNDETREKIRLFEKSVSCGGSKARLSPHTGTLNRLTEESAESILDVSDLSYDESMDTSRHLKVVLNNSRRVPRRSTNIISQEDQPRVRRLSAARTLVEGERIVATTTLTAVDGGVVLAESVLDTRMDTFEERAKKSRRSRDSRRVAQNAAATEFEPSAPPCEEPEEEEEDVHVQSSPYVPSHPVKRTLSNAGPQRPHHLVRKKLFKEEDCLPCGGKIKLGRSRYKCRDCGTTAHMDCKDLIPLPCVPSVSTPVKPGHFISDYTPPTGPMVPGLLVHCLQEIESRGLSELGLYRVAGSEREAQELLDKFFRNKGAPSLAKYDLGSITSCVKKFLRSLKEPLIPQSMWKSFVDASTNPDTTYAEAAVVQCIAELPRPNRDTLAFLLLHFQKIAASPETKMCVENIARIFGPTIVGYSSPDPSVMLSETPLQKEVMSALLNISADYWETFVVVVSTSSEDKGGSKYVGTPEGGFFNTPGGGNNFRAPSERKSKKFRALHPSRQIFQSPMI